MPDDQKMLPKIPSYDPDKITFVNYLQMIESMFETYEVSDVTTKKNLLLVNIGMDIFNTLCSLAAPKKPKELSYEELTKCLKRHYCIKPSYHSCLYEFRSRKLKETESINELYADLKKLAIECDFEENFEMMLRDQLFMAVDNQPYFQLLCSENFELKTLTPDKLLDRISTLEKVHRGAQSSGTQVNKVFFKGKFKPKGGACPPMSKCKHCGFPHKSENCKFKHYECNLCGKIGHLQKVCTADVKSNVKKSGKKFFRPGVKQVLIDNNEALFNIKDSDVNIKKIDKEIYNFALNKVLVALEIDSGACVSLIPRWIVEKIGAKVTPNDKILTAYGGSKIEILGSTQVEVDYNGLHTKHDFYVVEDSSPICGRDLMGKLKIGLSGVNPESRVNKVDVNCTNVQDLIRSYTTEENKPIQGFKAKVFLKPEAVPKFQKARVVPLAHKKLVDEAINDLEKNGIIEPIKFSDYASPIVPVLKKDGTMRICVDFKNVNSQLNVEKFPLPRLEEILAVVGKNKHFCKLDLSQAYLQMEVEEDHQKYLAISTEKGLFKFKRLPFGLASAPGIFQKFISQLLGGMEGVAVYLDDILICAPSVEKQLELMKQVLKKLADANVKLNIEKCLIDVPQLEYLGYTISKLGISPSKEKLKAVLEAPVPKNVSELQSFIGLVTYYSRFIKNFSEMLSPLYDLLKKNTKWFWSQKCTASFEKCKKSLGTPQVLATFKGEQLIIEADASPTGVGAVLLQVEGGVERPVCFASKRLSEAERNYSQTDREGLALVFAVQKFKYYVLGRRFNLRTDHRPLLGLFGRGKSIPTHANARLVRWSILLSQFDYDLSFKSGKSNVVADALSRLPIEDGPNSDTPMEYIKMVENVTLKKYSFEEIQVLTSEDLVLAKVVRYLKNGWSKSDSSINEYWCIRNDLSLYNGVVLFRNRIVIPSKIRMYFLNSLHVAHNGIVAMKEEARKFIFWPQMNNEIEEISKSCNTCAIKNRQAKEKILEWPEESKPWSRLHMDYAGPVDGKFILVIVDAYTKWIDAHVVNNPSSLVTMECLRMTFANFGIPAEVVSDNATYFVSKEMKIFFANNGVKLTNPSPYHPASNGLGERAVGILKDGLKKFKDGSLSTRVCRILYNYRRTVHSTTKKSPAFLMFSREFSSPIEIGREKAGAMEKGETETKFHVNQAVWVRNFGKGEEWVPGVVWEVKGLRNYLIKAYARSGEMFWRRHSDHLKLRYSEVNLEHTRDKNVQKSIPRSEREEDDDFIWVPKSNAREHSSTGKSSEMHNTGSEKASRSGRCIRPLIRLNL